MNDPGNTRTEKVRPTNEFVARWLRIFAVLGALALFGLSAGFALMLEVGHWLVREDSLHKAKAIAVLTGNFPARALEAASLYHNGYAGEIWLTRDGVQSNQLAEMGIHFPSETEFNYQVLRRQGVPAKAIHVLESPIVNTQDELEVISGALHQKNSNVSVILVTNKAHTRRVRELWDRLDSSHEEVIVHGISNDDFNPSAWWTRSSDTHQVIHELLGMINIWAGLPVQSGARARDSFAQNKLQQSPEIVPALDQGPTSDSDD